MTFFTRIRLSIGTLVMATLFMAVGWRERFPYSFPDLENYRDGFQSGWYVFTVLNLSWLKFLINEGTWVYLFDDLWRIVGDIDASFFIVSSASAALTILYICWKTEKIWPAIFIFNPAFANLMIEQLRSGLATGLFYIATLSKKWHVRIPLFVAAMSIHTAFVFFVMFFIGFHFMERTAIGKEIRARPLASLSIIIIFAGFAVFFRQEALAAIGDRRAFDVVEQSTGYLLVLGWSLFLATFFSTKKKEMLGFEYYFFVLNLFMLLFSVYFQTYGSRFIAIAIPALATMTRQIQTDKQIFFLLHYVVFSALYFVIWAN